MRQTREYRVWDEVEEATLKAGVTKHGLGAWEVIRKDPEFAMLSDRSGVQLKDKWRNLVKFRHVNPDDFRNLGHGHRRAQSQPPTVTRRIIKRSEVDSEDEEPAEALLGMRGGRQQALEERSPTGSRGDEQEADGQEDEEEEGGAGAALARLSQRDSGKRAVAPPRRFLDDYDVELDDPDYRVGGQRSARLPSGGASGGSSRGKKQRLSEDRRFGIYDRRRYADGDERGEGEDGQEEVYRVECPCGVGHDDGYLMIECEVCTTWAHVDCLQRQKQQDPHSYPYDFERYHCARCMNASASRAARRAAGDARRRAEQQQDISNLLLGLANEQQRTRVASAAGVDPLRAMSGMLGSIDSSNSAVAASAIAAAAAAAASHQAVAAAAHAAAGGANQVAVSPITGLVNSLTAAGTNGAAPRASAAAAAAAASAAAAAAAAGAAARVQAGGRSGSGGLFDHDAFDPSAQGHLLSDELDATQLSAMQCLLRGPTPTPHTSLPFGLTNLDATSLLGGWAAGMNPGSAAMMGMSAGMDASSVGVLPSALMGMHGSASSSLLNGMMAQLQAAGNVAAASAAANGTTAAGSSQPMSGAWPAGSGPRPATLPGPSHAQQQQQQSLLRTIQMQQLGLQQPRKPAAATDAMLAEIAAARNAGAGSAAPSTSSAAAAAAGSQQPPERSLSAMAGDALSAILAATGTTPVPDIAQQLSGLYGEGMPLPLRPSTPDAWSLLRAATPTPDAFALHSALNLGPLGNMGAGGPAAWGLLTSTPPPSDLMSLQALQQAAAAAQLHGAYGPMTAALLGGQPMAQGAPPASAPLASVAAATAPAPTLPTGPPTAPAPATATIEAAAPAPAAAAAAPAPVADGPSIKAEAPPIKAEAPPATAAASAPRPASPGLGFLSVPDDAVPPPQTAADHKPQEAVAAAVVPKAEGTAP